MKSPETIQLEGEEKEESAEHPSSQGDVSKEFFASNQAFFRHYAKDASLEVLPTLPGKSFAIDLQNGKIYEDPKFFTDKGYSLDKAAFATCHEIEHFKEMRELLDEPKGEAIWRRFNEKRKKKTRFRIMDNCFDDIKMNRGVLSNAPTLGETKDDLYKENLFPDIDYTVKPKHLQFSYGLLREAMLPSEKMKIAPDVQAEIDRLRSIKNRAGTSLLDYASDPRTSMSDRLKLQEAFLEPVLEKFFEEDKKKKEEEKNKGDKGRKDSNKGEGESDEAEQSEESEESEESENSQKSKSSKNKSLKGKPSNPEDYFKGDYEEYFDQNPQPANEKQIEEAVKKYIQARKEQKTPEQMAEEAYAKAEGVTYEELNEYREYWKEIEDMRNPETDEMVVEEIRAIFRRIITERTKPKFVPKLPTTEGEILSKPAEAVIAVKAGIEEPEIWETLEIREKPKELYGDFDVTLVNDRSGSMDGQKADEQRKASILITEALKEFSDDLDKLRNDLSYDLNVRTECWSFGDDRQVEILKPLGKELTEKQRVHIYKTLVDTSGSSTKDFAALENILDSISDEDLQEIEERKLKKIIIVTSDGESSDVSKLAEVLKDLREKGIIVIGVGISEEAQAVKDSYAPEGQVCEDSAKLSITLGDLLKKHLDDL